MKKRILAAFLAAMMVLSMTLLAGCDSLFSKDKDDDESEVELTNKELFEESIENLFEALKADDKLGAVTGEEAKPFESDISFKVTKLDFGGFDTSSLGNIELTGKVLYENENNYNADLSLSALGETMPYEFTVIDGVAYAIDLFGVNDKPIKMAPTSVGDYGEGANTALKTAEKMPAIMELVYNTFAKVIKANLDDELFTAETKDVKVLAHDFANAKVITLTFGSEKIGKIANEILDELLKDNDFVEMLGEDFDKAEFAENLKDIKELKLVNTIVDDKTVGFDVYLTALDDVEPEVDENEGSGVTGLAAAADESVADESVAEDGDKVEETFAIKVGFIKNENETGFAVTAGFLVKETGEFDAEETVLSFEFSENATEMKAVVKSVDNNGTKEPFKVEATINNGRYDGNIIIESDTTVLIGFTAEFGEDRTNFIIDGITVKEGSKTVQEIPLIVSFNINKDGSADGNIKIDVENMMTVEAEYTIGIEYKDVTIPAVTDSIDMDEVDGDKLLADIQTKYPTIAGLLGSLGGNDGGNEEMFEGEAHIINGEFVIMLPEGFQETTAQGYTAAYTDGEVYVFVLRESFEDFAGYDIDFEDYLNLVLAANANRNPTEIEYNDYYVPYFEYDFTNGGVTYSYYTSMYEGTNAYWLVQFACEKDVYADHLYDFEEWTFNIDPYLDIDASYDDTF